MVQAKCKERNQSKKTNGIKLPWIVLPYFLAQETTSSLLISQSSKLKSKYLSPKVHHHTARAYRPIKMEFENKWIRGVWVIRRISSNEEHPRSIRQCGQVIRMHKCRRKRLVNRLLWTISPLQMTLQGIIFSGNLLMGKLSHQEKSNNMWCPQTSLSTINSTRGHLCFKARFTARVQFLAQLYHMRPMMAQTSNPTSDLRLHQTIHR